MFDSYLETGQQSERDKEWVVPCCLSFFTCNTICIWRIWANPFLRTVHHVQCRWRQRKSDVLLRDSARLSHTNGDMSLCKTPLPSTHCNTGARSSSLSYVDCGFMANWWAKFKGLSVVGEWDKGVHMPLSMSSAVQFLTTVDCWREEETQSSSGWWLAAMRSIRLGSSNEVITIMEATKHYTFVCLRRWQIIKLITLRGLCMFSSNWSMNGRAFLLTNEGATFPTQTQLGPLSYLASWLE